MERLIIILFYNVINFDSTRQITKHLQKIMSHAAVVSRGRGSSSSHPSVHIIFNTFFSKCIRASWTSIAHYIFEMLNCEVFSHPLQINFLFLSNTCSEGIISLYIADSSSYYNLLDFASGSWLKYHIMYMGDEGYTQYHNIGGMA